MWVRRTILQKRLVLTINGVKSYTCKGRPWILEKSLYTLYRIGTEAVQWKEGLKKEVSNDILTKSNFSGCGGSSPPKRAGPGSDRVSRRA